MSYDVLSWLAIALLVFGIVGLLATIILEMSILRSKLVLTVFRGLFVFVGVIGALGLGALIFGILPNGPSKHSSATGISTTGNNGILTQGQTRSNTSGQ